MSKIFIECPPNYSYDKPALEKAIIKKISFSKSALANPVTITANGKTFSGSLRVLPQSTTFVIISEVNKKTASTKDNTGDDLGIGEMKTGDELLISNGLVVTKKGGSWYDVDGQSCNGTAAVLEAIAKK